MLHAQVPAVDPFDALAGRLPSTDPVVPKQPAYTGPEVKEVHYGHFVHLCVGACVCMCECTERVSDCIMLWHGSAVSNHVCCMYHSMASPLRRP